MVKNLNVSRYSEFDSVTENVKDLTLKAIFKCKHHLSILPIWNNSEKKQLIFQRSTLKIEKEHAQIR